MNIKLWGIALLASCFVTSAYGVNYKRLEFEADTYQQRIWSGVPSDEEMVKGSLLFLNDDQFDRKYARIDVFFKFYEETNDQIKNENFLRFSEVCKNIFEGSQNERDRAGVYMLLEKVREKSLSYLSSLKKLEKFKSGYSTPQKEKDSGGSLDYFLNVDKIQKVK